jgi:hypothetical protein
MSGQQLSEVIEIIKEWDIDQLRILRACINDQLAYDQQHNGDACPHCLGTLDGVIINGTCNGCGYTIE